MYHRICTIGLTLAAILPTVATAQQEPPAHREGSWEISLGGGILLNDRALRDFLGSGSALTRFANTATPGAIAPTAVVRLGYNFSPNWGVSVAAAGAMGSGVTNLTPAASLTYTMNLNAKTSPFILAGTQLTRLSGENDRVTHTEWGFHAGLGVRRMMSENLALRLEGRVRIEGYDETPMARTTVYNPVITLGISYFMGGRQPQSAPTAVMYPRPRVDTVIQVRRDTVVRVRRDTVLVADEDTEQVVLRVQFQTNMTTLLPRSLPVLDTIAMAIIATPASRWEVQGHTDSIGSAEDNRVLAQGRAQAVVEYLVRRGVNRSILTARGFGQDRPVFSNDTLAGRAQNRRVQLRRIPDAPVGRAVP